ncbi:HNH endonuclease signature motif containing protein [Streptomyces nojiriensis]|uniref:HNH endonuclease signature motif containing protein n=1 Tax=Streptomyces nojiriensis TaxID=66374 RepID=UPI00399ADB9E
MRRHGNLIGVAPQEPAEIRFWRKVQKTDECWIWTGGRGDHGYGGINGDDGRSVSTHRFSYQLHYGPIPDGMYVCHKCDNPACVRPDHLFAGTAQDNNQDMIRKGRRVSGWAERTECANGHPYDEANTRMDKNGHRKCRACNRAYDQKAAARKRSAEQ